MGHRDIIVIGASAGGIDVLTRLVHGLPPGLPASLFVVNHFPAGSRSRLPDILSRSGPLLASHARAGEAFYPGQVYVAPPDCHLMLGPGGSVQLSRGPRENHHRPAVDVLFRSAARHYGRRVIGVVLSGGLYDGTAGLLAIRAAGGLAVIQDPADAASAAMPQSAVDVAGADFVVPAADLARVLVREVHRPLATAGGSAMQDPIEKMPAVVDATRAEQARNGRRGEVSVFTCPECGGALWQVDEQAPVRFRCHVGHAYSAETLLVELAEALEAALWTAVRTFRERAVLGRQLALRERERNDPAAADRFDEQADRANQYSDLIRDLILNRLSAGEDRREPARTRQPTAAAGGPNDA